MIEVIKSPHAGSTVLSVGIPLFAGPDAVRQEKTARHRRVLRVGLPFWKGERDRDGFRCRRPGNSRVERDRRQEQNVTLHCHGKPLLVLW